MAVLLFIIAFMNNRYSFSFFLLLGCLLSNESLFGAFVGGSRFYTNPDEQHASISPTIFDSATLLHCLVLSRTHSSSDIQLIGTFKATQVATVDSGSYNATTHTYTPGPASSQPLTAVEGTGEVLKQFTGALLPVNLTVDLKTSTDIINVSRYKSGEYPLMLGGTGYVIFSSDSIVNGTITEYPTASYLLTDSLLNGLKSAPTGYLDNPSLISDKSQILYRLLTISSFIKENKVDFDSLLAGKNSMDSATILSYMLTDTDPSLGSQARQWISARLSDAKISQADLVSIIYVIHAFERHKVDSLTYHAYQKIVANLVKDVPDSIAYKEYCGCGLKIDILQM